MCVRLGFCQVYLPVEMETLPDSNNWILQSASENYGYQKVRPFRGVNETLRAPATRKQLPVYGRTKEHFREIRKSLFMS